MRYKFSLLKCFGKEISELESEDSLKLFVDSYIDKLNKLTKKLLDKDVSDNIKVFYEFSKMIELMKGKDTYSACDIKNKVILICRDLLIDGNLTISQLRAIVIHEYCHLLISILDPEVNKLILENKIQSHNMLFFIYKDLFTAAVGEEVDDSIIDYVNFSRNNKMTREDKIKYLVSIIGSKKNVKLDPPKEVTIDDVIKNLPEMCKLGTVTQTLDLDEHIREYS